ncbi:hypothetical protein [Streptomyces sp. URMC 129]|uniref:hypothetical protein n=1 Tax=Streptomyces sp. URMC 129 TaxID=3423407 RepID=UPI003F19E0B8
MSSVPGASAPAPHDLANGPVTPLFGRAAAGPAAQDSSRDETGFGTGRSTPGTPRARRAARHRDQVAAAVQTTLRLAQLRDDWDDATPAGGEDLELTDAQRQAAHEAFRARLRAAKSSRARGAAHAAATRQTAASGPLSPVPAAAADTTSPPTAGRLGTERTTLAPPVTETSTDLGKQPDPGDRYERRNNRAQARMRQLDNARAVSSLPSLIRCGAEALGGAVDITEKGDGHGGFAGLFRCGSVWACPECSPVVRADRAAGIETAAATWVEHGHGLAMATLTSRHGQYARLDTRARMARKGEALRDRTGTIVGTARGGEVVRDAKGEVVRDVGQLEATAGAWRRMLTSTWWRNLSRRYGLVGATRAIEVTHSWANSWHTHVHAVLWFEEPVPDHIARVIEGEMYKRWEAECRHAKLGRPTRRHGVKVDPARRGAEGAADIARYLVKVQDKDRDTAPTDALPNELRRTTADQAERLAAARARSAAARAEVNRAAAAADAAREAGDTTAAARAEVARARARRAGAAIDAEIADLRERTGEAKAARALGNELLRGDLKAARHTSRTPGELLQAALDATTTERRRLAAARAAAKAARADDAAAREAGDATAAARAAEALATADTDAAAARTDIAGQDDVRLWREYERGTKGHRMLTWSGAIKDRLAAYGVNVSEPDPQLVVAEDDARNTVGVLVQVRPEPFQETVAAVPGRRGQLRFAVKTATDTAKKAGLATTPAARETVIELLESWGLRHGLDFWVPGDTRYDPDTSEALHAPQEPLAPPPPRPPREDRTWQSVDDLDAGTHLLGIRPQDAVRPQMAARRAAGLPVARDITTATDPRTATDDRPLCTVCAEPVSPSIGTRHVLC